MSGRGSRSELDFWWRLGLAAVGLTFRLCFRTRHAAVERVPERGAAILAANHVSALDGLFLGWIVGTRRRRPTRFLSGVEFFRRPVIGFWLRAFGQIPIHRGAGDRRALEEAAATVRSGALAGIFPEGRVNPGEELQRGRSGAARIALAAGAPVIPVGLWGTQVRWPRDGLTFRRPFRPRIAISFGDPIEPRGDVGSFSDIQAFTRVVMAAIAEQVERARVLAGDPIVIGRSQETGP